VVGGIVELFEAPVVASDLCEMGCRYPGLSAAAGVVVVALGHPEFDATGFGDVPIGLFQKPR
jgi:hypothetical protein